MKKNSKSKKKKKTSEKVQISVYNALKVGKKQAMNRKQLVAATGICDRKVREAIEVLRHNRAILTLDGGNGYYIPDFTPQGAREAAEWIAMQNRRIESIKASLKGAQQFVKRERETIPGQISLFSAAGG